MPIYSCKIGLPSGQIETRDIVADDRHLLTSELESEGIHLFRATRKGSTWDNLFASTRRLPTKELIAFTQEFLVLLRAGTPILEVLQTLTDGDRSPLLKQALLDIHTDVKAGESLSKAFGHHPRIFPSLYLAAVRAGEKSGDIPQTVRRYMVHQKRIEAMRRRLRNAAFYPALLAGAGGLVLLFMLFYVLPRFSTIYANAAVELPLLTQILLQTSQTLIRTSPVWLSLLVFSAVAWRQLRHTLWMKRLLQRWKLSLPVIGPIYRDFSLLGFCQTVGTLLGSGFPAVQALQMSRGTVNNSLVEDRLAQAETQVQGGTLLSDALQQTGFFPPLAVRMIHTGERSGALEEMLEDLAFFFEERLETRLHRISTLFEPIMMVLIGLLIGGIVMAIYLPIFQLGTTI